MKRIMLLFMFSLNGFAFAESTSSFDFSFVEDSDNQELLKFNQAYESLLVKIISEPEAGLVHSLSALTNENGVLQGISRKSINNEQLISADDLLHKEVVVASASGRDALLVSCQDCNVSSGGTIKIRYLYNGITMSYESITLKMVYANSLWMLQTHDLQQVKTLRLVANEIFGQIIGIESILINE